jgi:hypothetical protein
MKPRTGKNCVCGCQSLPIDSHGYRSAELLNKSEHTPTPWHIEQARDGHFMIHETEGKSGVHEISLAHVKEERNAAFIVRAVNAHEELLATLRTAKGLMNVQGMDLGFINEAIAKAEGQTEHSSEAEGR